MAEDVVNTGDVDQAAAAVLSEISYANSNWIGKVFYYNDRKTLMTDKPSGLGGNFVIGSCSLPTGEVFPKCISAQKWTVPPPSDSVTVDGNQLIFVNIAPSGTFTAAETAKIETTRTALYAGAAGVASFEITKQPVASKDCTMPGDVITVTCTVKNSGSAAGVAVCTITAVGPSGNTYMAKSTPTTIAAGATKDIKVTFQIPNLTITQEETYTLCATVASS